MTSKWSGLMSGMYHKDTWFVRMPLDKEWGTTICLTWNTIVHVILRIYTYLKTHYITSTCKHKLKLHLYVPQTSWRTYGVHKRTTTQGNQGRLARRLSNLWKDLKWTTKCLNHSTNHTLVLLHLSRWGETPKSLFSLYTYTYYLFLHEHFT